MKTQNTYFYRKIIILFSGAVANGCYWLRANILFVWSPKGSVAITIKIDQMFWLNYKKSCVTVLAITLFRIFFPIVIERRV